MRWDMPELLFLLLLIPVLAVIVGFSWRIRRRAFARFAEARFFPHFLREYSRFHSYLKQGLLLTALALLIVAAARPQWNQREQEVKHRGLDIVVCFDVSKSMDTQDIAPSRMKAAKDDLLRMLDRLDGDRIALVSFAGRGFVQFPLTDDYDAARMFISSLDTESISYMGTDLGSAIDQGVELFENGEGRHDRLMLIVSDGEDLESGALQAAKKAHAKGIRIFALGVGTPQGGPVPDEGGYIHDQAGQTVISKLDARTLTEIARIGDGRLDLATPSQSEVASLSDAIGKLHRGEYEGKGSTKYQDQYPWFVIPALILLLIESLIHNRRPTKPSRMLES